MMIFISGAVLLLGGIVGVILCVVGHSTVLVFSLAFVALLVGGVLVFDNGSEKGLKFPNIASTFEVRRGLFLMRNLRNQLDRGDISEQEYEHRKREIMRKYGLGKDA